MANRGIIAVKACVGVGIVSVLAVIGACRTVPVDSCGKRIVADRPVPVDASIKFAANIQPNSFLALVLDSTTKRPLKGVSVDFPLLRLSAYTDSLGIVRVDDLPEGLHRVRVRRIGYEVRSDSVRVSRLSGAVAVYDLARRKVECATTASL